MRNRRLHVKVAVPMLAALVAAAVILVAGGASQASPGHPYLALGDSVSFGYITQAGYEYGNAKNFVGFPDYVGLTLGMTPTNAACPGETTAGFISATGIDNGCRPYKANYPLHTSYTGTQLAFATSFLHAHPNTKLVTLQLGANDAFIVERNCGNDPTCIQNALPTLLGTIGHNIDVIVHALESEHFHGTLVVVNYYSLDYWDPAGTGLTQLLNQAIETHARAAVRSSPTRSRRSLMQPRPPRGTRARRGS